MIETASILEVFLGVIQIPGVPIKIGTIIAVAMIVGFIVVDGYNTILKIILGLGVFIIANEWMSYLLRAEIAPETHSTTMPLISVAFVAFIFLIGLITGAIIGHRAKKREDVIIKAAESVIIEIENGGIQKLVE